MSHFEDGAFAVRAAVFGCSVEVAGSVDDQAGVGVGAVSPVGIEVGQRGDGTAAPGDLEHRAVASRASLRGCPIEGACGVGDEAGLGVLPIRSIQDGQGGKGVGGQQTAALEGLTTGSAPRLLFSRVRVIGTRCKRASGVHR